METKVFKTTNDECTYWKEFAKKHESDKLNCMNEIQGLVDETRQLERQIEIILYEKDVQNLKGNETMHELKKQISARDKKIKKLMDERDALKKYAGELEEKVEVFIAAMDHKEEMELDLQRQLREVRDCNQFLRIRSFENAVAKARNPPINQSGSMESINLDPNVSSSNGTPDTTITQVFIEGKTYPLGEQLTPPETPPSRKFKSLPKFKFMKWASCWRA